MVVPDANLLIYAYNSGATHHRAAVDWLKQTFEGTDIVGLCWPVLWAFLRISTNPKIWPNPKSIAEAFEAVAQLQEQPNAVMIHAGPRHAFLLRELSTTSGTSSNLVSDAALAAIAIEHAATLASSDRNFRKFSGLRWVNPLE